MPDGDERAHDRGVVLVAVNHRVVLDAALFADANFVLIAAQNDTEPNVGTGFNRDVADDRGIGSKECAGMDLRRPSSHRNDVRHHLPSNFGERFSRKAVTPSRWSLVLI